VSIPSFQRLQVTDPLLQRVQQNTGTVLDAIGSVGFLNGQLISYVTPAAGIKDGDIITINNPLGRPPTGVISCLAKGFDLLLNIATNTNPSPNSTILISSTGAIGGGITLNFWIF
jgi:hypothetical protein